MTLAVVAVIGCYALGCLTAGYYLVRLTAGGDVRAGGTGSTGARNVGRVAGARLAALTLALDCAKGAIAVAVAGAVTDSTAVAAAAMVAVVAGHVYPAQLHFRGGRGLATALGAMAVLDWRVALVGSGGGAAGNSRYPHADRGWTGRGGLSPGGRRSAGRPAGP